jgi:membrane protein required for colicin V production
MELVGFAALILAILGAFKLLHTGIEILSTHFPDLGTILPIIAFIIIFVGIIIIINLLGRALKNMMDLTILGAFDSVAGALLGIFKWAFLLSITVWLMDMIHINLPEDMTENSYLYPYIADFAPKIGSYVAAVFPFADNLFDSIRDLFN